MPVLFFVSEFYIFLLGAAVGSFLNCIIYRLPDPHFSFFKSMGGLSGRSACMHCKKQLVWSDLIPIASFLFLKGKCRYCGKKISIQYPLVEIMTGFLFLFVFNAKSLWISNTIIADTSFSQFQFLNFIHLIFLFFIISVLVVIFVYDLKHYLIPDKILFPAILVTIFYQCFNVLTQNQWYLGYNTFFSLGNYALAAIIASGFFLCIFLISQGAWMGFGDVKLAILLGLLLGFTNVVLGLFLAFLFGAIIGIILIYAKKKGLKSEIPFAPFLIIGALVAMFFGKEIIHWYTGFFI